MHSGLFIICCRAKAFLQLGLGDNQHSFLLKPGLQKRPFSSVAHPFDHPICPRAPKPGFLTWFQLPKKQRVHLKAERPKYLSAEMKARIVTRWRWICLEQACGMSMNLAQRAFQSYWEGAHATGSVSFSQKLLQIETQGPKEGRFQNTSWQESKYPGKTSGTGL